MFLFSEVITVSYWCPVSFSLRRSFCRCCVIYDFHFEISVQCTQSKHFLVLKAIEICLSEPRVDSRGALMVRFEVVMRRTIAFCSPFEESCSPIPYQTFQSYRRRAVYLFFQLCQTHIQLTTINAVMYLCPNPYGIGILGHACLTLCPARFTSLHRTYNFHSP